jgi:Hemerythrin HHE cation binding domain
MPRLDLFTSIHKAIRALIYDTGGKLQRVDFADGRAAVKATADLIPVLSLLRDHHDTEEQFVFPKVRRFDGALIDDLESQHRTIETLLAIAGDAVVAADEAGPSDRGGAGVELNRRFNELTAFYLEHIAHEEVTILPVTWEHFADAQLGAIQGAIMGSMEPELMLQWLSWMFRGLNREELVGMLAGAKTNMPAPALEAITDLGAASMEPTAWQVVRDQAGL